MAGAALPAKDTSGLGPGDHCSDAFFERMGALHREAEQMRQQCRRAANGSHHVEKVSLDEVRRNVGAAQDTSSVARRVAELKNSTAFAGAMPLCLGHLTLPGALEGAIEGPNRQPRQPQQLELEFFLPGAVDAAQEAPEEAADQAGQGTEPGSASNATPAAGDTPFMGEETLRPKQAPPALASPGGPQSSSSVPLSARSAPAAVELQVPGPGEDGEGEDANSFDSEGSMDSQMALYNSGPRAPLLRFRTRIQFSQRFKPHKPLGHHRLHFEDKKEMAQFEKLLDPADNRAIAKEHSAETKHTVVHWINKYLEMDITTPQQFEAGFPIIILTMLDAVFPARVRWREVDWLLKYRRAVHKNYAVLQSIWGEVRMEKTREFRMESLALRVGSMATCSLSQKLDFMMLMQRWFDRRIHSRGPFNAMARRRETFSQCKMWGHKIDFPVWIKFDEDADDDDTHRRTSFVSNHYGMMPEFKRLIWFLGSAEHQTL